MHQSFAQKLQNLPRQPGVYIFKDAKGLILYVGKAVNLKSRVSSYFKKDAEPDRPRVQAMLPIIADVAYTVTDNEHESLILENNFIKQLRPRYNVMLRDDKNYLFLKINIQDEIPTIEYERKIMDRRARYFGPYTSGLAVKDTMRFLRRVFPYCANDKIGLKPCFYYHIGKCPGVCFGKIGLAEYRELYIKKIIKFLEGWQSEVLKDLQQQMKTAAGKRQFERAAKTRDQIFALNRMLERQKIVYPQKISQDVFSLYQDGSTCINLFIIREGKLIRKENFILENTKGASPREIFEQFLPKYYLEAADRPREILLPTLVESAGLPKILTPSRGAKFDLLKLGTENAKQYLESQSDKHLLEEARLMASLKELQRVLDLPKLPARMEAYDISNIQGANPVGSMVVFDFARPKKDQYRKFKINRKQTPDDFAMMREMLERRFKNNWPLPDLILIDGGKGQLNAALKVMRNAELISASHDERSRNKFGIANIPIIGLAKRLEEIFRPGQPKSLILQPNSIALFLLQRIRDEAHRFAVKYHRQLRTRQSLTSVLDGISGIGPNKKKKLLEQFGSAQKIRTASLTELAAIIGSKTAQKLKASV